MNQAEKTEAFLAHFGVKGMRWGYRKSQPASGSNHSNYSVPASNSQKLGDAELSKRVAARDIKSVSKSLPSTNEPKGGLTTRQKQALLGGLAAVAIAGGAYAYYRSNPSGGLPGSASSYLEQSQNAKSNMIGSGSFYHKSSFDRPELTFPPGHTFSRISSAAEDSFGVATYSNGSAADNNRYVGSYFAYRDATKEPLYQVSFKAAQTIKVPNLSTTLDTLKSVMESDSGRSVSNKSVMDTYQNLSGGNFDKGLGLKLTQSLKQKGYSALVDEADAGLISDRPLVFFNHDGLVAKTSQRLTNSDIQKASYAMTPMEHPKL